MAERLLCKERVRSSSLLVSTTPLRRVPPTIEELGITRGKRQTHRARSSGPTIEPLIRALPSAGRPPTSGSLGTIASYRSSEAYSCGPAPLQLDSVRQKRRNLRFRRVKSRKSDPEIPSVDGRLVRGWRGSSYKGHGVDALAPRADEGRGRLRKASGSREQTVIRRCPNGETRLGSCPVTPG